MNQNNEYSEHRLNFAGGLGGIHMGNLSFYPYDTLADTVLSVDGVLHEC